MHIVGKNILLNRIDEVIERGFNAAGKDILIPF